MDKQVVVLDLGDLRREGERLADEARARAEAKALADKAVQDKFLAVGADLVPPELQTSKGFGDYIRKEYAASAEAAKIANLKPE